jgi:hypothetical protein
MIIVVQESNGNHNLLVKELPTLDYNFVQDPLTGGVENTHGQRILKNLPAIQYIAID